MKFEFKADCTFEANDIVDAMGKLSVFFKEMNQEYDKVDKYIAYSIKGDISIKPVI